MIGRSRGLVPGVALLLTLALLAPSPASAQALIKVNDNVNFRLGIQLQAWGDWLQEPVSGSYAQNLYIRRIRFIVAGQLAPDVTFFFQTDNPNIGKAPKDLSTGFIVQDAWVGWKIDNALRLDAGLFLVPLCRNCLQSTTSFTTLDISPLSVLENAVTQSSGTRDTGFGWKGYLLKDHLEYRAYIFAGARDAGSKNSFRYSGRVQYDVFDTETGYVYQGLNFGKKKILAFGVGSDNQENYHAYAGDAFFDFPILKGDEIAGQVSWIHYDGQQRYTALPRQNAYLGELGYYCSTLKLEPFIQYTSDRFSDPVNYVKSADRFQGGLQYFVYGNNLKFSAAFTRIVPHHASGIPNSNQFSVQVQAFYF